jgi:hypothetical protein
MRPRSRERNASVCVRRRVPQAQPLEVYVPHFDGDPRDLAKCECDRAAGAAADKASHTKEARHRDPPAATGWVGSASSDERSDDEA